MDDSIFGTPSTEESRIQHLRDTHGGITHLSHRVPRDPQPGEAVKIILTTRKLRLATLWQFTPSQSPIIYYGSEESAFVNPAHLPIITPH